MKKRENFHLPPIGLRIIKSAAAVFLCYCVDLMRSGTGIVFYSQLAALWCMQDYVSDTKQNARQRLIGTAVGAAFGLLTLILLPILSLLFENGIFIQQIVVSLMIIGVLYTTVLLRRKQASYFSCVVYLSIVVNHAKDADPYLFVWNRVLDTLIGIAIGVAVNLLRLPRERNKDILFISGLDDTLLTKEHVLSGFTRVELNRLLDDGALFTVSTMRTPASIMEPLQDIRLRLPVIAMDGAVLYDISEKRYVYSYMISDKRTEETISFLRSLNVHWFANVIIDDMLVIYCQNTDDEIYNRLIETYRLSPYRNYVKQDVPAGQGVVYFMLIDQKERIEKIYQALDAHGFTQKLKVLKYDSTDYPGCAYIKIYNHNATKENMIDYLKERLQAERVITFGSIAGKYTYTITPGGEEQVVKIMKKLYEPIKHPKKYRSNSSYRSNS